MSGRTYPVLRQFFGAYLNADWPEEYGSPLAAAAAFAKETPRPRAIAAVAEIDDLIANARTPAAVATLVEELGCEYALDPEIDDPLAFLRELRSTFVSS